MPSSSPYLRPSQPSPISKPVGSCFSTVHPLVHTTPYAGCVQTSHVTLPLPTTKASSSAWLSSCNSQPCQNPAHIGPGSSSALVALASVVLSTTQQPPFGHLGRTLQTHCAAKRQTYSNRWSATCKHQPQPCQQSSVSPMFKPSSTTSASPPPLARENATPSISPTARSTTSLA